MASEIRSALLRALRSGRQFDIRSATLAGCIKADPRLLGDPRRIAAAESLIKRTLVDGTPIPAATRAHVLPVLGNVAEAVVEVILEELGWQPVSDDIAGFSAGHGIDLLMLDPALERMIAIEVKSTIQPSRWRAEVQVIVLDPGLSSAEVANVLTVTSPAEDARELLTLFESVWNHRQNSAWDAWALALSAEPQTPRFYRRHLLACARLARLLEYAETLPDKQRGPIDRFANRWWSLLVPPAGQWGDALERTTQASSDSIDSLAMLGRGLPDDPYQGSNADGFTLSDTADLIATCQEWISVVRDAEGLTDESRANLLQALADLIYHAWNISYFGAQSVGEHLDVTVTQMRSAADNLSPDRRGDWLVKVEDFINRTAKFSGSLKTLGRLVVASVGVLFGNVDISQQLALSALPVEGELLPLDDEESATDQPDEPGD